MGNLAYRLNETIRDTLAFMEINTMHDAERDQMLLAILEPEDRAMIEAAADQFIEEELPHPSRDELCAAAALFDERGLLLPLEDRLVAMQIAAALRIKALGEIRVQ
jgi:hypothetical protein